MGRQLHRVALDFDWPVGKVWEGFLNPHPYPEERCPHCKSGSSPEATLLQARWYGNAPFKPEDRGSTPFTIEHPAIRSLAEWHIKNSPDFYGTGEIAIVRECTRLCMLFNRQWSHHLNQDDVNALVEAGRLMDFTHTWEKGKGWERKDPPYVPTAAEVNVWSLSGFGHDSINCWRVIRAECERQGWPVSCTHCLGRPDRALAVEAKAAYEGWEAPDGPPKGEGWQMWETVTEGSPISPVFATGEELARWLAEHESRDGTYEQWCRMIFGGGWAPSMMAIGNTVMSGVQGMST